MRYLVVDGEMFGSGIRDGVNGGYLDSKMLGLSPKLRQELADWLERYNQAHIGNYADAVEVENSTRPASN